MVQVFWSSLQRMLQDVSLAQSLGIFFFSFSFSCFYWIQGSQIIWQYFQCCQSRLYVCRNRPGEAGPHYQEDQNIYDFRRNRVLYMDILTRICRPIQHQHAIPAHLRYTYIDCACIVLFEKKKGILIDPEVGTSKSIFLAKFSTTSNYSYTSHGLHGQKRSVPQPELSVWVACMRSVNCHLYDGPETRSQVLLDELLSRQTTTTTY